jgi:hypothetical protein
MVKYDAVRKYLDETTARLDTNAKQDYGENIQYI